jgi:hypothetical protein
MAEPKGLGRYLTNQICGSRRRRCIPQRLKPLEFGDVFGPAKQLAEKVSRESLFLHREMV